MNKIPALRKQGATGRSSKHQTDVQCIIIKCVSEINIFRLKCQYISIQLHSAADQHLDWRMKYFYLPHPLIFLQLIHDQWQ